jgi:hypothetical protein
LEQLAIADSALNVKIWRAIVAPPLRFSDILSELESWPLPQVARMTSRKDRRSGRVSKNVPILLIGTNYEGRVFTEETHTVMLSFHGAGIVSRQKLMAEQELVLRLTETGREAEIRVVGKIGSQGHLHTYGVAFLDEGLDFWQLEFPPPPSLAERPLELVLECSGCNATVTLLNGDYEFDVCAIHGGLVRYCVACGFATVWKRAESGGAPRAMPAKADKKTESWPQTAGRAGNVGIELELPAKPEPEQPVERFAFQVLDRAAARAKAAQPAASGSHDAARTGTAALEDRRQRVRAKVSYFACVRSEAFGEDIVTCIDMSRGGLGFWTKNAYLVTTQVTIAVPFSPEAPKAPAIYVPARIVNVAEAPERKMFRCGVAFLPTAGAQAHT